MFLSSDPVRMKVLSLNRPSKNVADYFRTSPLGRAILCAEERSDKWPRKKGDGGKNLAERYRNKEQETERRKGKGDEARADRTSIEPRILP